MSAVWRVVSMIFCRSRDHISCDHMAVSVDTVNGCSDRACGAETADLVRAVSEFSQHRLGIGAHLARRMLDRGAAMREFERRQRPAARAVDAWRRVEFVKDAAGREMRIGERFRHRAHPCGGHMPRLEIGFPYIRRSGLDDICDDL